MLMRRDQRPASVLVTSVDVLLLLLAPLDIGVEVPPVVIRRRTNLTLVLLLDVPFLVDLVHQPVLVLLLDGAVLGPLVASTQEAVLTHGPGEDELILLRA